MDDFLTNLTVRFVANQWIEAIDFTKFAIVGSCVLNALCHPPFSDTHLQDINLIYPTTDGACFESAVFDAIMKLRRMDSLNKRDQLRVEQIPSTLQCFVHLSNGITLNFFNTPPEDAKNPLSHILHNFDMDITQVAFVGRISHLGRNARQLFCWCVWRCWIHRNYFLPFRWSNHLDVCFPASCGNENIRCVQSARRSTKGCVQSYPEILCARILLVGTTHLWWWLRRIDTAMWGSFTPDWA